MKVSPTGLPEKLVLQSEVLGEGRGLFLESWDARNFAAATGLDVAFVRDDHSHFVCGLLHGFH
jgi:dTDP-4-dehydrorhamnose 3,5-epimerase